MHTVSSIAKVAFCGLLLVVIAASANAQFKASIQGTITDTAGGLVPEATVTVTNKETGKSQQVTSSGEGFYRVSGLAPGSYTVTAEKTGYTKKILENVSVRAEAAEGVDIVLQAGEVTATVTVSAEAASLLQTENANVDKTITNQEVLRLPQASRDPYQLLRLAPGVFGEGARTASGGAANLPNTSGPGGSSVSIFATENQVPISANGQRVSANNFQVDGVSVNSQTWGGAAVITPSQESVKQVQVTSSTYSAEDGRNSGAQIRVVTQNGTNDFHGSAFFRYADPGLNAFNKFHGIPGTTRTSVPQRVEQKNRSYGGSIGGPIVHDRAFFFFSYEGFRSSTNNTYEALVESSQLFPLIRAARPNSIAARVLADPGVTPRLLAIIPRTCADLRFIPTCQLLPGGFDIGSPTGATGQYVPFSSPQGGGPDGIPDLQYALLANPTSFRGNQYFTRVDYNVTQKDTVSVSAFFTPVTTVASDSAAQSRPMADIRSKRLNWDLAAIYTRNISATMLNEARFNITRWGFNEVDSNPNINFGIPRISIEGLTADDRRLLFGADRSENTPGVISERQLQFSDILTKTHSNMSWKFGGDYRLDLNNNTGTGGARPLYSFVRPWNFANDTPIFEAINEDLNGNPIANNTPFKSADLGFFVQDDWKYRPNLTFNLGLRWEYFQPITAGGSSGVIGNLDLGSNPLATATLVTSHKLTKSDLNNFGPQLGFAWSPQNFFGRDQFLGNEFRDRFVLRGGFGIGYDRLPNALLANTRANPPNGSRFNICCAGAGAAGGEDWARPFAEGAISYALGSSNSPLSFPQNPNFSSAPQQFKPIEIYGTVSDLPSAYVYRYSLEGQYELPARLTATLGYQGSAGHKFVRIAPEHLVAPTQNSTLLAPAARLGSVYFAIPDVNSNYNAMLARLQRRFANGFQFDLNYRWSKSIDSYSYEAPCGCTNQTFPIDQHQERGPSDFDVRHNFVASFLWDLPFMRDRKDLTGRMLGGWEINAIVTTHSGFPWTPKVSQSFRLQNGNFFGPIRPVAFFGNQPLSNTNSNFLSPGGIFPGGGAAYFSTTVNNDASGTPTFALNVPGIGRNRFRGPRYFSTDMSLVKRFGIGKLGKLGENTNLELRANFFNIFNTLNLAPFGSGGGNVFVTNPNFGEATAALAGRVIELQARFSF
jgi:hypothetical protein